MTEEESKAWFEIWKYEAREQRIEFGSLETIFKAFKARLKAESGAKDD